MRRALESHREETDALREERAGLRASLEEEQVILPTGTRGVERRAEFGTLGPLAGCFLALGSGLLEPAC